MIKTIIRGVGSFLPEEVVTNQQLAQELGVSADWIFEKSGISQRRFAKEGMTVSEMGLKASKAALEDAKVSMEEIGLIIFSTLNPEYIFPGPACLLQEKLNSVGKPALDIRAECSGFIYGLEIADKFIRSGSYRNILLVCSELHSTGLEFSPRGRDISMLFGDGAGAVVIGSADDVDNKEFRDSEVVSVVVHSDGRFAKILYCDSPFSKWQKGIVDLKRGDWYPQMDGKNLILQASLRIEEVIKELLKINNISLDEVDYIIPHQANLQLLKRIVQKMGIKEEKLCTNIGYTGNTSSASIPICLDEFVKKGVIKRSDRIILVAFGSGIRWGASYIRF